MDALRKREFAFVFGDHGLHPGMVTSIVQMKRRQAVKTAQSSPPGSLRVTPTYRVHKGDKWYAIHAIVKIAGATTISPMISRSR